jgi:hypothetical protein
MIVMRGVQPLVSLSLFALAYARLTVVKGRRDQGVGSAGVGILDHKGRARAIRFGGNGVLMVLLLTFLCRTHTS